MGFVLYSLVPTLVVFVILNIFGIMLVYIAQIRGRLVQLLNENLKLLNKMHEGLMIISEKDLCLQFASKPAIAVLKQMPLKKGSQDISSTKDTSPILIDLKDLEKQIFKDSRVSVNNENVINDAPKL